MKKLSKTQQELYDALKAGVILHYMPYAGRFNPNPYYFRHDNMKLCTAAAKALLERDLAEKYNVDQFGGRHLVRIKS